MRQRERGQDPGPRHRNAPARQAEQLREELALARREAATAAAAASEAHQGQASDAEKAAALQAELQKTKEEACLAFIAT